VLIAAGRSDPFASIERVEALADRLRTAGAVVDLRWTEGGHELGADEIDAVAEWLTVPTGSRRKAP
jgi:predicted esterase